MMSPLQKGPIHRGAAEDAENYRRENLRNLRIDRLFAVESNDKMRG
jgi:hypothetical protein